MGPKELKKPNKKEVEDWLNLSRCDKFNIFDDQNLIIATLSYHLLDAWRELDEIKKEKG